ncbi:N-acetylglucosamine phosphatase [Entophlyctis helioformis]|nr:N-acetylglucosamine phosphatase [Entophlyctis helioformis]
MADAPAFAADKLSLLSELSDTEYAARLQAIRDKEGFICDMDGVIYHGSILLPGVKEFIAWLRQHGKRFLFLTNNSAPTPRELSQKLKRLGLDVDEQHFYTSAIATARFLKSQKPNGGTCYVIGDPGLTFALYEEGFTMSDSAPDYVVIGEGKSHNFEKASRSMAYSHERTRTDLQGCQLVAGGAKLIGTNPDVTGPAEHGIEPATGAFVAAIELATGKRAFYCGKPSSLMMRYAQTMLGTHKSDTCIIGDRMDTDILAGTYAQIDPVLVMSGVTNETNLFEHAYRPYIVLNGVGEIVGPVTPADQRATPAHTDA